MAACPVKVLAPRCRSTPAVKVNNLRNHIFDHLDPHDDHHQDESQREALHWLVTNLIAKMCISALQYRFSQNSGGFSAMQSIAMLSFGQLQCK